MQVMTNGVISQQKEMPISAKTGFPNINYKADSTGNSLKSRIPQQLRDGTHWLNWVDAKGNKSPVNAVGSLKGYNDQSTWVQLELALDRCGDGGKRLGLTLKEGGLLLEDGYLWCLDFDGWVSGSEFDEGVLDLVKDLGTLTEVSQSGTGLKLYMTSDKLPLEKFKIQFPPSKFAAINPNVRKYQNREIEVFSKRSFLATTFDLVEAGSTELRHITGKELGALFERLQQWAISTGGAGCKEPKWRDSSKPQTTCQSSTIKPRAEYKRLTLEQLDVALVHIDADDEQGWTDVANVLARVYGEDGRESWHVYSKQSDKYDFNRCDERYDRALRELVNRPDGYGIKHLIELASTHPNWGQVSTKFEYWGELPVQGELFDGLPDTQQVINPIEQVNQKFAWDSRNLLLYSRQSRMYIPESAFKTNYLNQQIMVGGRSQPLGSAWLSSSKRLEVNGLRMAPDEGAITKSGELNTWLGYSVEPAEGDVDAFLCAFSYLFPDSGDKDFVLAFLAKMIQCPESRFNVALGVYGEVEGTGKNTIFEAVGALFHPHHFKVISGAELDRDFNEWQLDKVFVLGDEVSNAGDRRLADKVKRMVTGTSNHINPKHKPAFEQPNLIKYVFLSNHQEILHINDHDRRYYIAKTSDERLPALVADNFYEWKANGGLSHLLHFLMEYDCSSFDPTKPAPMTEAKKEVIDAGRSGLESWVEQVIPSYRENGQLLVSAEELVNAYGQVAAKSVAKALIAAGARRLKKRAVGLTKQRHYLYALGGDIERFEAMSETQLGKEWLEQGVSRMGVVSPR